MSQHFLNANKDFGVNPRKLSNLAAHIKANIATMDAESLAKIGYGGMTATQDAQIAQLSTNNLPGLNQFLQNWLPGNVNAITAPRRAEELLGFVQAGSFEDETVVARFNEFFGYTQPYGDLADVQRSGYNTEFINRQIVRFQGGIQSDTLESARMAKVGISDIDNKRAALLRSFSITENFVSFNGWSNTRCFGLFNDPNLPSYATLPAVGTGSSALWSSKTTAQQQQDILLSVSALYTQTKTAFDPYTEEFTWAVSPYVMMQLSNLISISGGTAVYTLRNWVESQYKNIRIIAIPEFAGANGGADVWYMYKENTVSVDDSTDDGKTIVNLLQTRMFQLSALPTKSGGVAENYASAQAGVFAKRPILIVRYTGMN